MGKTIKRKGNVRKTRKHLKRKRGGNPDRIEKLKEIVEYYLQYIYYKYFFTRYENTMHIDLPKNEWYEKPGLFGDTLIVKSKSYKFTFNEYMQNTIPIAPRLSRDKLIPRINERARGIHYAYQLIPKYIFSDEYMSEMDTKIQTMITQNDTDLISAYITDKLYLDMVDSNRDFYNIMDKLYLDMVDSNRDFYNIMDKMLEKTYDYNNDELIEDY